MAEAEYVLARKILKLANRIVSGRNADIRDLGLTSSQADSLVYFVHNEGRSAVDLKDHLGVTHQTARGIVKRMAEKNLIEIRISEEDGRYRRIFVTEKGRSLYRQMEKNGAHTGNRLLTGMSPEEKQQFSSLVSLALENMER